MAVEPRGVQMCQLIKFPYLQAAHPQSRWVRYENLRSRLNQTSSHNRRTVKFSLFHPKLFNESPSIVSTQLKVIIVQPEQEGNNKKKERERLWKMTRMSGHRPLMALSQWKAWYMVICLLCVIQPRFTQWLGSHSTNLWETETGNKSLGVLIAVYLLCTLVLVPND